MIKKKKKLNILLLVNMFNYPIVFCDTGSPIRHEFPRTQTESDVYMAFSSLHCMRASLCAQSLGRVQLFVTPRIGLYPTRLIYPWHFPSKNTAAGCYFPLQGILSTQESNPHFLHPGIEPSSLATRDRALISCIPCISRQILYHCTTWEAHSIS